MNERDIVRNIKDKIKIHLLEEICDNCELHLGEQIKSFEGILVSETASSLYTTSSPL